MRRSWPLGVQLNLLLLLVIVPFLGAVAYQYWTDVEQARENAGKRLVLIARALAADANSDLVHAQDLLRLMARRPLIRAVDSSRCDPFLEQFAQLHPEWSNAGVVDLRGRLVCTVEPYRGKGLYAIANRGLFFDEAVRTGRAVISRPFLGPLTKTWVVVMAQPIRGADGSVRGLLVAALHLAKLRQMEGGDQQAPYGSVRPADRLRHDHDPGLGQRPEEGPADDRAPGAHRLVEEQAAVRDRIQPLAAIGFDRAHQAAAQVDHARIGPFRVKLRELLEKRVAAGGIDRPDQRPPGHQPEQVLRVHEVRVRVCGQCACDQHQALAGILARLLNVGPVLVGHRAQEGHDHQQQQQIELNAERPGAPHESSPVEP